MSQHSDKPEPINKDIIRNKDNDRLELQVKMVQSLSFMELIALVEAEFLKEPVFLLSDNCMPKELMIVPGTDYEGLFWG
jgi:hypothetical protein